MPSSRRRETRRENLRRLAGCMAAQTVRPAAWLIVDNGSTDDTLRRRARASPPSIPGSRSSTCPASPADARRPCRAGVLGGRRAARLAAGRRRRQDRRGRLVRPPTTSSGCSSVRRRPDARHRRRHLLRARGRRVEAAARDGQPRPRRVARLPLGLLPGRPAAREPARLGRDRRDAGCGTRLASAGFADLAFRHHRRVGGRDGVAGGGSARSARAAPLHGLPAERTPAPEPLQGPPGARRRSRDGRRTSRRRCGASRAARTRRPRRTCGASRRLRDVRSGRARRSGAG